MAVEGAKPRKLGYFFREVKNLPYPAWATQSILSDFPDVDRELLDFLQRLWELHEKQTDLIKEGIAVVKNEAKKENIAVKAVPTCCHRETCGVCLGKYTGHFPYIYIKTIGEKGNGYQDWRLVPTRDVRAFLGRFISAEKVRELEILVWHREYFLTLYHYLCLDLSLLGLVEKVV